MSLPGSDFLILQAYADGELEGTELAAAEKLVAENADARAFVESLVVLGYGVRAAHELEPLPAIDVTSAVMGKLEAEPVAQVRPAASVTSLAAQRERRAQKSQVVVMIGALALAAAGILYLRGRGEETPKPEVASVPTPSASGVEVSNIDSSGDKNVSVFYLPASGGNAASSVVVWIDEKGAP